jgi:hypothetical protein
VGGEMNFLTLIQTSDVAVCINFDHIAAITRDEDGCTKVWEVGDSDVYWRVREKPEEILAMLKCCECEKERR